MKRPGSLFTYEPITGRVRKIICWSHMFSKEFKYRHWDSLQMRSQTQKDPDKVKDD